MPLFFPIDVPQVVRRDACLPLVPSCGVAVGPVEHIVGVESAAA